MKLGGGRAKGYGFENQIAKLFSTWWGIEKSFVRSPGSGAWGKLSKFVGNCPAGDLVTPDEFPFTIECKKCEDIQLHHILINSEGCSIACWLKKLEEEDCKISGKRPMLIFSKNNWKAYVVVRCNAFDKLANLFPKKGDPIHFIWKGYAVFLLDDLLKGVTKDRLLVEFPEFVKNGQ
jgi:hypothetical protein